MTNGERFAKAEQVAAIIQSAGEAMTGVGAAARVSAAAWQKGDLVRVYVTDGRGYTGRQHGFLTIDGDGDVVGTNGLTGTQGQRAMRALETAGIECYA